MDDDPSPAPSRNLEPHWPPTEDDLGLWCDYVRGLTSPHLTARLDALRRTSPEADRLARLFAAVAELGMADASSQVPADARRLAHALGSLRRPVGPLEVQPRRWRRLAFDVIFDSLEAPAAAGVRDLRPLRPSQRVYESGDLVVEVRYECDDGDGAVVVGQVVRLHPPAQPVAGVPVLLVADQQVVARTTSGRFGEFYCDRLPSTELRLWMIVAEESLLDLPVGESSPPGE